MKSFIIHLRTELKYIFRNPVFFGILIITPILLLTVSLMFIPTERVMDSVRIGVLGEDKTFIGNYLANFILGFLKQENVYKINNYEEAQESLDKGKMDGLIIIPFGFTAKMLQQEQTYISYVPSSASLLESVTIYKLLKMGLGEIKYGAMIEMNLDEKITPGADVPIPQLVIEGIEHNTLDYPDVMAPGILAFVILSTMLIGITGSVSREKDLGIMDGFRITNASRTAYVMGKFVSYSILGIIQTIVLLWGSVYIMNIHFEGSLLTVGIFLGMGMLIYLSLGLLISVLSPNREISMGISVGIVFLMFLGGGVFFPLSQMPSLMQSISGFLPITPLVDSLRKIVIAGKDISFMINDMVYLVVYLCVTLIASLVAFKISTK